MKYVENSIFVDTWAEISVFDMTILSRHRGYSEKAVCTYIYYGMVSNPKDSGICTAWVEGWEHLLQAGYF